MSPLTDPIAIEVKAKELWQQRERAIFEMWGIKSKRWEDATEKGRDLMRNEARLGKNNWLEFP